VIVDCHTHVFLREHLGAPFVDEIRGPGGAPWSLDADARAHAAGTAAADVAICFGMQARHIGFVVPNDFVAEVVRADPARLIGFAGIDPSLPGAVAEIDRCADELGLAGIKLGPPYADVDPRDERMDPVYARAQHRGLPVLLHTGTTPHATAPLRFGHPEAIDDVARRYPALRIVMAHVSHPWEREAIAVVRKHAHVYADVSALVYRPFQLWQTLWSAHEYAADGKLLLGSDFPIVSTQDTIDGLRALAAAPRWGPPVPAEVVEGIIERDTLALLGLEPPR